LGLYGGADAGIPNDTVERINEALKKAGKKSSITGRAIAGSRRTTAGSARPSGSGSTGFRGSGCPFREG
jgi:hypothetical protein